MRVLAHPCVPRLFDVMHSVRFVHLVTEDGGADLFELLARHAKVEHNMITVVARAAVPRRGAFLDGRRRRASSVERRRASWWCRFQRLWCSWMCRRLRRL